MLYATKARTKVIPDTTTSIGSIDCWYYNSIVKTGTRNSALIYTDCFIRESVYSDIVGQQNIVIPKRILTRDIHMQASNKI